MTTNAVAERPAPPTASAIELALVQGDLSKLTPGERVAYYRRTCDSLGLNPLTRPFDYLTLNGKLILYARKDCTDQLRKLNGVSIGKPDIQQVDDLIIVSVTAKDRDGREDSDLGVVKKSDMRGDLANAMMKAITKAKRRVTLSICGLGMLDETEVETIPDARPVPVEAAHHPAAVEDRPADAPAAGEAQAAPAMLRTELGHLIRRVAELRKLEPDYVFAKLRDGVRVRFPDAADTTSAWGPGPLRYGIDLATNSLRKAEEQAAQAAAQPAPEREPGIDDEPEDEQGPDPQTPPTTPATSAGSTLKTASAQTPSSAPATPTTPQTTNGPVPESKLPKPVIDQVFAEMREAGIGWQALVKESPRVIGRQLATNARVTDLTLSEGSRVIDWAKRTKAEKAKARKEEAAAA